MVLLSVMWSEHIHCTYAGSAGNEEANAVVEGGQRGTPPVANKEAVDHQALNVENNNKDNTVSNKCSKMSGRL